MNFNTDNIHRLRDLLLRLGPRAEPGRPRESWQEDGAMDTPLTPEEAATLERFFPFAELLFLVAHRDGELSDFERATVLGAFGALTGGHLPRAALARIEAESERLHRTSELDTRLNAICSRLALDRDDAELAFVLATAVALADDRVAVEEQELLDELGEWLGLSPRTISRLLASRDSLAPPPLR